MRPVYQDRFGKEGNCLQAALASLFDLPLDEVPYMHPLKGQWMALERWCATRDLRPVGFSVNGVKPFPDYHLMQGVSKRGIRHTIVGYQGKPVHDPHPEGNCEMQSIDTWVVFIKLFNGDK
jgi:hypothetical protein